MVTVRVSNNGVFGAEFIKRLDTLERATENAAKSAAAEAQRVSKDKAKAIRPPAPPRPGRAQAPGALARAINWKAVGTDVVLDRQALDKQVPWWVVQEIGTGNTATAQSGEDTDGPNRVGQGRPAKKNTNVAGGKHFKVKKQRGRLIPGTLAFGNAGGQWQAPKRGRRSDQLFPMSSLKGGPSGPGRPLVIRNEIPPKRFIQTGAREGFRDYRNDVVAAARATLAKRK